MNGQHRPGTHPLYAMLRREREIAGLGMLLAAAISTMAPTVTRIALSPPNELAARLSLKASYVGMATDAGFTLEADPALGDREIKLLDPNGRTAGVMRLT